MFATTHEINSVRRGLQQKNLKEVQKTWKEKVDYFWMVEEGATHIYRPKPLTCTVVYEKHELYLEKEKYI